MICDFCGEREASIFMEQNSFTGQRRTISMCLQCALERGISSDPRSITGESIGSLFRELASVTKKIAEGEQKYCPVCATPLGEIRKTGKTGCPECYAIFKDDIRKILETNGVTEPFRGTMPARLATVRSVLTDRMILQSKLERAVQKEDYEQAAMYRDYLKALEKSAVSGVEDESDKESI